MVGQVADLVFAEMVVRVEDFYFEVEIASFVAEFVMGMVVKVEDSDFEVVATDFVMEFVVEDNSNMMEDIDNINKIFHKDFVFLEPNFEIEIEIEVEVEAKVFANNSNFVGVEYTFDCYIPNFVAPAKVF